MHRLRPALPRSSGSSRWGGSPLGRLARRPAFYWIVAVTLSVSTAWLASDVIADAERARHQWGERRTVLVARHLIEAGETVTLGQVVERDLPLVAIPPGSVHDLEPGRTAVTAILPGEVLLGRRLSGTGEAQLIPAGTAAVAVAIGPGSPPLEPGDLVQLWATLDPFAAVAASEPVAHDAVVLDVGDSHALIAVRRVELGPTTLALGQGAVTVALVAR